MEAKEIAHLRSKYKDRMLALAFIVSGWSPQKEGGHGCVLAVDGKYIVATGFTGPDRFGRPPEKDCGGTCCGPDIVHAEVNAVLNMRLAGVQVNTHLAGVKSRSKTLVAYVTKKPCKGCFEQLRAAGVSVMFWLQDCNGYACGWAEGQGEPDGGYGEQRAPERDNAGGQGA